MEAALVRELVQVAAGDMRHKLQPGAPRAKRAGQGRQGWTPLGPRPSTAPMLTSQCSCCPSPQGFRRTLSSGLPLAFQPQAPCSPGVTP